MAILAILGHFGLPGPSIRLKTHGNGAILGPRAQNGQKWPFWAIWPPIGQIWPILAYFGLFWPILGPKWVIFDPILGPHFGPHLGHIPHWVGRLLAGTAQKGVQNGSK